MNLINLSPHPIPVCKKFFLVCFATAAAFSSWPWANAQTKTDTAPAFTSQKTWGTYLTPFAVNSSWNSRPVNPKFKDDVIPLAKYPAIVEEGDYSAGVFLSQATDAPVTVTGLPGTKGLYDTDTETLHDVTVPRWPANLVPARGADGHANIVDPVTGILHSFWQLKRVNGQWAATGYAWTRVDGRGWGDPSHYSQGPRATGGPTAAGLIRKHEVMDGDDLYRHALTLSLAPNGLSADPAYIYPATSADFNAATTNTGAIPEGALMMLPPSFDLQQIGNPAVRKIARTLKEYGAYVIDRNGGSTFSIAAEIGSAYSVQAPPFHPVVSADMEKIRLALRPVASVDGWLDGDNRPYTPEKNLNLLSMRGVYWIQSGTAQGYYDSYAQAVIIPTSPGGGRTVLANFTTRGLQSVTWAKATAGLKYRLTSITTGDARLRLKLYDPSSKATLFDSGDLQNGAAVSFIWPSPNAKANIFVTSGMDTPSTVRGELFLVN